MISDEIIKVINELCNKFGIAIDWTSQNVIPYLQDLMSRYIKYDIALNIFEIIIGIICLIIAVISFIEWRKETKKEYEDETKEICLIMTSAAIGTMAIILLITEPKAIIQDIYIPEKTVYEYMQSQIK